MPLIVACGNCDRKLSLREEVLGKLVRCPACQTTFRATEEPRKAPKPVVEEVRPIEDELSPDDLSTDFDAITDKPREIKRETLSRRKPAPWERTHEEEDVQETEDEERPRRRKRSSSSGGSRHWIILAALAVLVGAGVLVAMLPKLLAPPRIDENAWIDFSPPGSKFTIRLPGTPRMMVQPVPGTAITMKVYEVNLTKPNCAFALTWLEIPPHEFNLIPLEQRFQGAKQGMLANTPGATFVSERDLTVEGCRTREVVMKIHNQGKATARLVVVGTDIAILLAGGDKFEPDSPDVLKFFDSFKLKQR